MTMQQHIDADRESRNTQFLTEQDCEVGYMKIVIGSEVLLIWSETSK
jgi:hypothetical protein